MNALVIVFAFLAGANAGLIPAAQILQGPSSRTTVAGPDGSAISAIAPGGQVVTDGHSTVLAQPAPVAAIRSAAPVFAAGPVAVAHAAPFGVAAAAPIALAHAAAEGQYVHDFTETLYDDGSYRPQPQLTPLAPSPYGLTPAGSGLEGHYVHDFTETLFDDGSYRGN